MWFVANWATPVLPTLPTLEHSVVALVISGWMMSIVEEESRRYLAVDIVDGEVITVATGKTQGWSVESRWLEMIPKRFRLLFLWVVIFFGGSWRTHFEEILLLVFLSQSLACTVLYSTSEAFKII